jgi:hypothetical protein
VIFTKKHLLIFSIFIVCFSQLVLIANVTAATEPTFDYANLSGANFQLSLSGLNGNVRSSVGAARLDRVEKINTINIDENTKLATSRAHVYISVVIWSEVRPEQAVSATKTTQSREWLKLITCKEETWKTNYLVTPFAASFDNYINPSIAAAAQGFSGNVQFNAQAVSLVPSMLDFGNTQYEISGKEFTSSLNQIVIVGAASQPVGQYSTIVQQSGQTTLSTLDVPISKAAAQTQADQASSALSSYIDNSNLGFTRMPQSTPTLQTGALTPHAVGSVATNGMYVRIVPDVKLIKEPLKVRSQTIGVDTQTDWAKTSPARIINSWCTPVSENTIDRVIGWHVDNYAIKIDLRVEFNLYSKYTVKQIVDPATPTLAIPDVQINDQIIESNLNGDTGADIVVQSESPIDAWFSDLWTDYWYIIIPAGILILAILAFVAFTYINGATGGALGAAIGNKIRSSK